MTFKPLSSVLEDAGSALELAVALGAQCQIDPASIARLDGDPAGQVVGLELEQRVAAVDHREILAPGEGGGYAHLLDAEGVRDCVEEAEAYSPLEHAAFLRGLLPALRSFYDDCEGEVDLLPGLPLPLAARPYTGPFRRTPKLETSKGSDLLRRPGFYLFGPGRDNRWPIVLDFGVRARLDALTWLDKERLPRIATIHPHLGPDGIEIAEVGETSFFGVTPRHWNRDEILAQLKSVAGEVEVAILPELSLPVVDSLAAALEAEPDAYPPIVVAGSAHLTERTKAGEVIRANEARIYLDGEQVARHRKIKPVKLHRAADGEMLAQPLEEALTTEPKPVTVLGGEFTRLAVLICADVNHDELYELLVDAGVNLLLIPALTPDPGAFGGSISAIASQCQGVSVVVNGDPAVFQSSDSEAFLVMVGLPRSNLGEQTSQIDPPDSLPCVGIVDPNVEMQATFHWMSQPGSLE